MENPDFLKDKYQLQNSDEVESAAYRTEMREGEPVSPKPAQRIQNYLDRFNEILNREDEEKRERGIEALRKLLHEKFIISSEEIPESTFLLEQRIARELGYGDVEITEEFREQKTNEIISNQRRSLDAWIDYLASPDATYPDWAKYWAFRSVTEMGKLVKEEDEEGKESARYIKRTRDSVASFPTLNPRALAMTISVLEARLTEKAKQKNARQPVPNQSTLLDEDEFQELLASENFAKIYAQFLIELPEYRAEGLENTNGQWVKYLQGTDPQPLVDSLNGHPLEWCTANYDTAKTQLEGGDFYVYYSEDQHGNPTIPRAAIRMQSSGIAEVRGIASYQHLDPYIAGVVEEKMKDFPDGAKYQKKSEDMKRLTQIEQCMKHGDPSKEDLRFLYEIDAPINGFGYEKDPRVAELLEGRDKRADISTAIGCLPSQVSLNEQEALGGDIVFHYGDLDLSTLNGGDKLVLPKRVSGYLGIHYLISANGLTFPQHVGGYLDLENLESAEGLVLPKHIGLSLFLHKLTSPTGLTLPEYIGGGLYLDNIESADGLVFPERLHGSLDLYSLESTEGLVLPSHLSGYLDLTHLTSAKGLVLPKHIGGYLTLDSLTSIDGLILPDHVGGNIRLPNIPHDDRLRLRESYPHLWIEN